MRFFRSLIAGTAALVLPLVTFADHQQPDIVHGTINVAIENQNGMVVLTDSMITRGGHQLDDPGEKLFKLDDRTVCAIAGFSWAAAVSSSHAEVIDLNASTSAVIHEYIREAAGRTLSISEKTQALAFLMGRQLETIANVRDALQNPTPIEGYRFQFIVAGYDVDDKPKISQVELRLKMNPTRSFDAEVSSASLVEVGGKIIWRLNGIRDVADQLLNNPKLKSKDSVLALYATVTERDGGESLSVDQLKQIAQRMKGYTEQQYREVGGPDQIAVFEKGKPVSVQEPSFPVPPRPVVHYALMVNVSVSNFGPIGGSAPTIFVRCYWNGTQRQLDDNYFIANQFANSVITYDGGKLNLGDSNEVTNSVLVLGPHAKVTDDAVKRLMKSFTWSRVLKAVPKGAEGSPAASNQ